MINRKTAHAAIIAITTMLGCELAWGFTVPVHKDITENILTEIEVTVAENTTGTSVIKFSPEAIEEIKEANAAVDNLDSAASVHPERHFTDEQFAQSSKLLNEKTAAIIENLTKAPLLGTKPRELLGQALHTIQDFYAHTNWTFLRGNASTKQTLEKLLDAGTLALGPEPCSLDDPNKLSENGGLTSGYYLGVSIGCEFDRAFDFDGETVRFREKLGPGDAGFQPGKCIHGNYAELTEVHLGGSTDITIGCPGTNNDCQGDCGPAREGLDVNSFLKPFLGAGAEIIDFIASSFDQLVGTKETKYHKNAVSAAEQSTKDYLDYVIDKIKTTLPEGDVVPAIVALLDVRGTVGFVIDTTSSMAPHLESIKDAVSKEVISLASLLPETAPDNFVLVNLKEAVFPHANLDAVSLLKEVEELSASGGGDCEEDIGLALRSAVSKTSPGLQSQIFVYTDGGINDLSDYNIALKQAAKRNIEITEIRYGRCVSNCSLFITEPRVFVHVVCKTLEQPAFGERGVFKVSGSCSSSTGGQNRLGQISASSMASANVSGSDNILLSLEIINNVSFSSGTPTAFGASSQALIEATTPTLCLIPNNPDNLGQLPREITGTLSVMAKHTGDGPLFNFAGPLPFLEGDLKSLLGDNAPSFLANFQGDVSIRVRDLSSGFLMIPSMRFRYSTTSPMSTVTVGSQTLTGNVSLSINPPSGYTLGECRCP